MALLLAGHPQYKGLFLGDLRIIAGRLSLFLERLPGGLMDKRLLPCGFVWGVSLVAVYAAVLTLFFSHISATILAWGFVLGALLAALYTHHDRPELPKDEELRADKIDGMKVIHWHIIFWLLVVICVMDGFYDLLSTPSPDAEASRVSTTFVGVMGGWITTRMLFLI